MRFLPQSLFWRLMWVLLAGLLVTQLLSVLINFEARDQLLLKSSGMQSAQRIAETVLLLESLSPQEQKRIVAILNVPPQVVTLAVSPLEVTAPDTADGAARVFADALQQALGDERQIRVVPTLRTAAMVAHGPGYGRRRAMLEGKEFVPGMYRFSPDDPAVVAGVSFQAQVRLQDGQWLRFDTALPTASASLPWRLLLTLGVLSLAVLLLSFIAVRWLTRPLHVLAGAAEELGKDINRPPLPENGPTEVRQAARAFNTMQSRLARFIADRTRIFSAMSHDLKTPLTRLRLRAEMLDDESLRLRFEKDLLEMESMVTQTLDFMRGLESTQGQQSVDMMALLESLQADYAEMGQVLKISGKALLPLSGVALQLKRCLTNVFDNAIAYGQLAEVMVEDSAERLILRIRDHGPGIPEAEQEKVFEPFYRLEASRNRETGGTGLGLTIARSIMHAHGGEIVLKNCAEGGLELVLTLPREAGA